MEPHLLVGHLAARSDVRSVATLNSYHFFPKALTNVRPLTAERMYEIASQLTTGRVLRRMMPRIDAFVAISDALRDIYWENGFAGSRIEHVPHMADPSFSMPSRTGDHDTFRLLYVGALEPLTGMKHLVEAMRELPADVRLCVVGGGRQQARNASRQTRGWTTESNSTGICCTRRCPVATWLPMRSFSPFCSPNRSYRRRRSVRSRTSRRPYRYRWSTGGRSRRGVALPARRPDGTGRSGSAGDGEVEDCVRGGCPDASRLRSGAPPAVRRDLTSRRPLHGTAQGPPLGSADRALTPVNANRHDIAHMNHFSTRLRGPRSTPNRSSMLRTRRTSSG